MYILVCVAGCMRQMVRLASKDADISDLQTFAVDAAHSHASSTRVAPLSDAIVSVECELLRTQCAQLSRKLVQQG